MKLLPYLICVVAVGCSDVGAPADGDDPPNDIVVAPERDLNSPGTDALLAQMMADDAAHYQAAVAAGVKFFPTSDGESFYAYWEPPGFDPANDGVVLSLHGHGAFVSSGFSAWQPFVTPRRYAWVALQWWFGRDQTINDYYLPIEIYPAFQIALAEQHLRTTDLLFEGFSRGSANSYGVAAIDNAQVSPMFALAIANSGGMIPDFPPNADIIAGAFGAQPYAGQHWVLFCGGLDPDPDQSGCPGMANSEIWLESYGGIVDLFIQDPTAGHGGFHLNGNADRALDVYDALRTP